jgi:hypothetical protein
VYIDILFKTGLGNEDKSGSCLPEPHNGKRKETAIAMSIGRKM